MEDIRWVTSSTVQGVFAALEASVWTTHFEEPMPSKYILVIVAQSEKEWNTERGLMLKFRDSGKAISTPKGSTFTPTPLGKFAPVCLVFGDAMSAFQGCLSRQLGAIPHFRPTTEGLFDGVVPDDNRALEQLDKNALSFVQSWVTRQYVLEAGVSPVTATGFSLGELVMQWCDSPLTPSVTAALSSADRNSPLWKDEALCGQMNVLRRLWGIADSVPTSEFFSAWLIMNFDVDKIVASIDQAARVRVVVIESDRRCIIVGHPESCQAIAASHGVSLTPFTMSLLAHCDWIPYDMAEAAGFGYWNPAVTSLSAQAYAKRFAAMYTTCVDFRGQVRRAYDEGCRVFLEVGCDNKRTSAICEILSGKADFVAVAMDGKVGDAKMHHRRVWAQLISNGFQLFHKKAALLAPNYRTSTSDANQLMPRQTTTSTTGDEGTSTSLKSGTSSGDEDPQ